ncbi:class F sortase [Bacillus sp. H-16]|uniref:class F sortase n=1 Tax=Alteribacter salitolerans TaxID=2912333 RepID=UPI0019659C40|nr:class F sortase [Alteribacter salitolerans]MBM7095182.1 class F sortase [Alteribacter salitolerans]
MKLRIFILSLGLAILAGFTFVYGSNEGMTETEWKADPEFEGDPIQKDTSVPEEEEPGAIDLNDEFVRLGGEEDDQADTKPEPAPEYGIVPLSLSIPAIEVEADIEPVGVLDNGQMGVPADAEGVAWFEPGTMPGNTGNAVLAGHVDSRTGPAVFWDLNKLEPGDELHVTGEDGEPLTFEVQVTVSYGRNDAPIEEIFGPTDKKRLNLITCSGTFDRAEGTHDQRLVVYTELIEPEEPAEENTVEGEPPAAPGNVTVQHNRISWHAVRDEAVIGYRIYRENKETGAFDHIESVSAHERKSIQSEGAADYAFYITSVNGDGLESDPSEIASFGDE